jgi:hypothetical protein
MPIPRFTPLLSLLTLCVFLGFTLAPTPPAVAARPAPSTDVPLNAFGASAPFFENIGQFDPEARFQLKSRNGTLWLTDNAMWLSFITPANTTTNRFSAMPPAAESAVSESGVHLKLEFIGANTTPIIEPFDAQDAHVSYFRGNDPTKWQSGVPSWGGVRYRELYPQIDLEIRSEHGVWQPYLIPHAGADLTKVRLRVEGADTLVAEANGIRVETEVGTAFLPLFTLDTVESLEGPPVITGNVVSAPFTLAVEAGAALARGEEDLVYSTFLGGSSIDEVFANLADASGNVYVVGRTYSADFPSTPGVFQEDCYGGCSRADGFITKLNPDGTDAIFSTFLGHGEQDEILAVALDSAGAVYVTGFTSSSSFPTTPGAFQQQCGSCANRPDAFVTKLSPNGDALLYSTFLGGERDDYGAAISIGSDGLASVTGTTWSADFPVTPGAYDTTFIPPRNDIFVTKLNASGTDLIYSTYIGGDDGFDEGSGVAVSPGGEVTVTGLTTAPDYPTTPGAYQTTRLGGYDGVVARLNAAGTALIYSTYLGGNADDYPGEVHLAQDGSAYIAGFTASENFPTTPGAYQRTFAGGNYDAFVTKLNPTGSNLIYSTYVGGAATEGGYAVGMDVNSHGEVYIAGLTYSADYPTTADAYQPNFAGHHDAFLSIVSADGNALRYSTFFGGSSQDYGNDVSVDPLGIAYISGWTVSFDLPITPGAFQPSCGCGGFADDGFVAKIAPGMIVPPTATPTVPVTPSPTRTPSPTSTPTPLPPPSTPKLNYGTFLGGTASDQILDIALDGTGALFVTGLTYSDDFPTTPGVFDTTFGSVHDVFVSKLSADGSELLYSSYLSGSDISREEGQSIAVDAGGNAYVIGSTNSATFPTTAGAYQTTRAGGYDSFIFKLNASGSALAYATYLGGTNYECNSGGCDIVVDDTGAAYVTGHTYSDDFPTTTGVVQPVAPTALNAFVTKVNPAGSDLIYSTYLGGNNEEYGFSIQVDSTNNAYVTGYTWSSDFPSTAGAFDEFFNGTTDAYVTKLNAEGSAFVYSTFLGDGSADGGSALFVNAAGEVYLTGSTGSAGFPVTDGAYQTICGGCGQGWYDAYVAKFNTAGSALEFATFLGGSGNNGARFANDSGSGIAVDAEGYIYLTGYTDALDYPVTFDAIQGYCGCIVEPYWPDAILARFNPTASQLIYSTFIGDIPVDVSNALELGEDNNVYIAGSTVSNSLYTTADAYQPTNAGGGEGFILNFRFPVGPTPTPTATATPTVKVTVTTMNTPSPSATVGGNPTMTPSVTGTALPPTTTATATMPGVTSTPVVVTPSATLPSVTLTPPTAQWRLYLPLVQR